MSTPLCILLVDDSRFFLELEKQFLKNTPATLLTAESGEKALFLAVEHRPSLIFMDVDMPKMDGVQCCRQLKSNPELCKIPVILIGDSGRDHGREEAMAAGADMFLEKPLDRRVFLGAGHSYLVSIDRREPRKAHNITVEFICGGRRLKGDCVDISSGGMFLDCSPTAQVGERLSLKFSLPDEHGTFLHIDGRIAWVNSSDQVIKENYPFGYGVEFVDISEVAGVALRRCFQA